MKKYFLLFLFLSELLSASQTEYELKIYQAIFQALFPNKNVIHVWSDSQTTNRVFTKTRNIQLVTAPAQADILLLGTGENATNLNGLKFATNYKTFKKYKRSLIGGFYWQKGRPNIIFIKRNLEKYHITLPKSMSEYIENY
ncbi:hypothetical protein LCX93_01565 [Sulfurimonas sp. SWIR-19]|uniref:hypothetical protein n=1 Tax=Sulfurimonas sp. SWIR-19 TaxID=2878390 RepID=UPI001CF4A910|nr:hypothetical protein [Sulfurimonas sp. SWIR-19]UCN00631.1 hypothetical protein LCX93_01565 [Sulfurimonas sp. SWIR-19]